MVFLASGQPDRIPSERSSRSKQKIDNFFDRAQPFLVQIQSRQNILLNGLPELKNASALQKLDSTISRELDQGSGIWHNSWKNEYTYNALPAVSTYREKGWNSEEAKWKVHDWTEIDYDNNGLPEAYTIWTTNNGTTEELHLDSKMTAHYSTSGILDSILFWTYAPPGTWILETGMYYYYHTSGSLEKIEMIILEEDEGEIIETVMVYKLGYDSQQRLISTEVSILYGEEELIYSRIDYEWNSSGKLTSYEISALSFFTFTLEKSFRIEIQYNQEGDISVETESTWNSTTSAWEQSERNEYTYGNINSSDVVFPNMLSIAYGTGYEVNSQSGKAPMVVNTFERVNNNWLNTGKTTYFYSGGATTALTEPLISESRVYPNPFTDRLYFQWSAKATELKVEVYSISGIRVIEQTITRDNPVDTRHLPGGTYLYRLTDGGRLLDTGRLVRR
jgi:hypothetical protein